MLIFGFVGETGGNAAVMGAIATAAWLYIIYEVFSGEAGQLQAVMLQHKAHLIQSDGS